MSRGDSRYHSVITSRATRASATLCLLRLAHGKTYSLSGVPGDSARCGSACVAHVQLLPAANAITKRTKKATHSTDPMIPRTRPTPAFLRPAGKRSPTSISLISRLPNAQASGPNTKPYGVRARIPNTRTIVALLFEGFRGWPHRGQVGAWEDTSWPHAGHGRRTTLSDSPACAMLSPVPRAAAAHRGSAPSILVTVIPIWQVVRWRVDGFRGWEEGAEGLSAPQL